MHGLLLRSGGAAAVLLGLVGPLVAAPPHLQLLPGAATKEYVSSPDVRQMNEPWQQTQFAKLLKDEALSALADQVMQRFNSGSDMARRLGFGWDEVRDAAMGEATWAMLQAGADKHSAVVLVNVASNIDKARAKFAEALTKRRITGQEQTIDGLAATVYVLNGRKAYHVIKDDTFIAIDDLDVLRMLLARWDGDKSGSLEELPAFKAIADRVKAETREPVHLRWFLEPMGRADVLRASRPRTPTTPSKTEPRDWLQILRTQGFDTIEGIGGIMSFNTGDHDLLLRVAIRAPKPKGSPTYPKAMGLASFLPLENAAPPAWVPDALASPLGSWTTLAGDAAQAFTGLGFLFDAVRKPGYFETLLKQYRTENKVDVRKEIIAQIGKRASILNDYKLPADKTSERRLYVLELAGGADSTKVAAAVERMLDPEGGLVRKHAEKDAVVWELLPDPNAPPADQQPLFNVNAVAVWKGHLLMGTNVDVVLDFVRQDAQSKRLNSAADYQRVQQAIEKLGASSSCVRLFVRPESDFLVPYELLRVNKLGDAQALSARVFAMLMGLDRRNPEKNRFDGSKLPEFKAVTPHLGPMGGFLAITDDGWVGAAFVLKK